VRGEHPDIGVKFNTFVRGTVPNGGEHVERSPLEEQRPRTLYRFTSLGGPNAFVVHNNNYLNQRRGLLERVMFVEGPGGALQEPPAPADKVLRNRLRSFARQFDREPNCHPWAMEQFVEHYDGRRKVIYSQAAESLRAVAIRRQDSYLATFVKAEKTAITAAKPDPAPRLIQPRGPRYNVAVGCYISQLEKRVYKRIAYVWGGPTVMKGYNAKQVARHILDAWEASGFKEPCAIGLDASRFDQHVSVDALTWEHERYLRFFKGLDRATLNELLLWQRFNKGFIRSHEATIKYTKAGSRMSGDMNTALGNCLLMCAMVYALCEELGIRGRLFNNGDDCQVIMDRADECRFRAAVQPWFLQMGFNMKVEPTAYEPEHIEFCQTRPVYDGAEWVMCRDPRVCLAKDCVSTLDLSNSKAQTKLLGNIGDCGLSLAGGLPVMQEFYNAMRRNATGRFQRATPQLDSGFARLAAGMSRHYAEVTPRARYSFWRAFGIEPDLQLALESTLKQWTYAPGAPRVSLNNCDTDPLFTANHLL